MSLKLVIMSDTHGKHDRVKVPDGDALIHAGDFTGDEDVYSVISFLKWFESQPHRRKIFIAGNHDRWFETQPDLAKEMVKEYAPTCNYLQDSGVYVDDFFFWGSPVTPAFGNWAFNRERGADIKRHWDMIPDKTDVLITHGPPFGPHGLDISGFDKERCGCRDLYDAMMRVNPDVHAFGHIHHSYGTNKMIHDDGTWTWLFNASICNEAYKPTRHPWVFELC